MRIISFFVSIINIAIFLLAVFPGAFILFIDYSNKDISLVTLWSLIGIWVLPMIISVVNLVLGIKIVGGTLKNKKNVYLSIILTTISILVLMVFWFV